MLNRLFNQTWIKLRKDCPGLADSHYPGVYLLAYSDRDLVGKLVKENDVFYVGMSHAGVRNRLKQFLKGIENGKKHSGAIRFFRDIAGGVPYRKFREKKTFLVASLSIPCMTSKPKRSPSDLRKMAQVAALEWHVLARIKEKVGREPELNRR